jgi:hypothetical protein
MKQLKVFDFADIFRYAEKHYGILWNAANDVFFGNSLDYGSHTTWYPGDYGGYIDQDILLPAKASDFTKEQVLAMTPCDQSYVILDAYFESLNITDREVLVNCS